MIFVPAFPACWSIITAARSSLSMGAENAEYDVQALWRLEALRDLVPQRQGIGVVTVALTILVVKLQDVLAGLEMQALKGYYLARHVI